MELQLPLTERPQRLKTFLQSRGLSGTYWKKLKAAGALQVNGETVQQDLLLQPGSRIRWDFLPEACTLEPEEKLPAILEETELYLAVDKPAGLVTHNAGAERTPALSRQVAWYFRQQGIPSAVHPVSRLDRETSGVVLFAKNACLHHMLAQRKLEKTYLGITLGAWKESTGLLDGPIARKPGSIVERQVAPGGLPARTRYQVLAEEDGLSLVLFRLETGRTHQIRVHAVAAGHPLLGDTLYGAPGAPGRHYLHAWKIRFREPFTEKEAEITAPLPQDFQRAWGCRSNILPMLG
ncbi:RluA family pseudouridine synthase [Acidaminococcus sp. LBK-2]|uniref:RluA family pseudouridine synthase n=1 Tax=Acidaminococcus sp. LBK-2 TaxID=3456956 RepID=UPI003FA42210